MASVMVVDDTVHVRRMLRDMLELDGFDVVAEAGSVVEAIEQLAGVEPDVIVLDYMLPDVDGLEGARRIREVRPEQMLILYSAFIDPAVADQARALGIDVCIDKTEGVESLEREIARLASSL
jgi:CheY-like chemotaxis protein